MYGPFKNTVSWWFGQLQQTVMGNAEFGPWKKAMYRARGPTKYNAIRQKRLAWTNTYKEILWPKIESITTIMAQ